MFPWTEDLLFRTLIQRLSQPPRCGSSGGLTKPPVEPCRWNPTMRTAQMTSLRITNLQSSPWRQRSSMIQYQLSRDTSNWPSLTAGTSLNSLMLDALRAARSSSQGNVLARGIPIGKSRLSGSRLVRPEWAEESSATPSSTGRPTAVEPSEASTDSPGVTPR